MSLVIRPLGSELANWVLRIKDSSAGSRWKDVFLQYREFKRAGVQSLDHTMYPSVMKACSALSFAHGTSVHACLVKQGLHFFTSVANSAMDFYTKFGSWDSALKIFGWGENRDSVSWNIIIHRGFSLGDSSDGLRWFRKARVAGFEPNVSTLVLVSHAFRECGDVVDGMKLHGYLIRSGLLGSLSVRNSLLGLYGDVDIAAAVDMFDEMPERDVISWSVMISGCANRGESQMACALFHDMLCSGSCEPDEVTVLGVFNACASLRNVSLARLVHRIAICRGFYEDMYVGNALVDTYSKCGVVDSAVEVFDQMPQRNIVSWNSLLSGLVGNDQYSESLSLFEMMGKEGVETDEVTVVNLLQTCKKFADPLQYKSVHGHVLHRAMESNHLVVNSLLDVYAKCNLVDLAWRLFKGLKRRDVVSWSTMIAGFANCGRPDEALVVYQAMVETEIPNAVTILNLIDACSLLSEKKSKWAHGIAIRKYFAEEVAVGTAILDMYSKCGLIESAKKAFYQIRNKNIISWSAMITAYGMNGLTRDALALLDQLELHGPKPNAVTYLAALSACSHGGMVEEGLSIFTQMVQTHNPEPGIEHYSCIVDMLGRAGRLEMALDLINGMPEKLRANPSLWSGFLSACRSYGNYKLIPKIVSHLLELDPSNSAGYLLASSIHAANGTWEDAARLRSLANRGGLKAEAGYSIVHIDNKAYRFLAGDKSHPLAADNFKSVCQLHRCLQKTLSM
uniref:Uncharacterized protein n=1 Tax=Kalanchoe fedtschenkoi TaxID=63787 RepID=A0A7N0UQ41_KALFE